MRNRSVLGWTPKAFGSLPPFMIRRVRHARPEHHSITAGREQTSPPLARVTDRYHTASAKRPRKH
jgi:hypothetical protein